MKPLAWSDYCPNDCDKKPAGPEPGMCLFPATMDDFLDEEITKDLGINPAKFNADADDPPLEIDWAFVDSDLDLGADLGWQDIGKTQCQDCMSMDTEAFENCTVGDWRCVTCGHVWYK